MATTWLLIACLCCQLAGLGQAAGYTLDKVGNRESRASSIAVVASATNAFNNRDWLSGDTYDANGNTTLTIGLSQPDVYDFEDHLIIRRKPDGSTVNLSYDADGLLRQKTVLNAASLLVSATGYFQDTLNPTGYAQIMEERINAAAGTTVKLYTYGSDLISQAVTAPGASTPVLRYFTYDGLGSVRELTSETGTVTDAFDYDAFGILVYRSGTTDNAYLYRGERFESDIGQYYLRARFYNQNTGRFWNQDSYEGSASDPMSLHKYLYANGDPIRSFDPSGHSATIADTGFTSGLVGTLVTKIAIPRIAVAATLAVNALIFTAIYDAASAPAIGARKQQLIDEELRAEGKSRADVLTRSRKPPPIFPDPISIWHEVAEHDGLVQSIFPLWRILHVGPRGRDTAREFAKINREESGRSAGLVSQPGFDRHEYPYASTLEGGLPAVSALVNSGDNRSQGQALAAFYAANQLQLGDSFIVLVLP